MIRPLHGLRVELPGASLANPEATWAGWFLSGLGASVLHTSEDRARARVDGEAPPNLGVPAGVVGLAGGYLLAAAALTTFAVGDTAAPRRGDTIVIDRTDIARLIALPAVLSAVTATPLAATPGAPLPWGDGALCTDLGAGDDRDAFARLAEVVGSVDADTMAERAQEWRLPVTPYRKRRLAAAEHPLRVLTDGPAPYHRQTPVGRQILVVDLTVMWSGPLCTAALQQRGMSVVKIEPACRPDGLRFGPGEHLHRLLNAGKTRLPLDLRVARDHAAFLDLVERADLVIDNFSPRVAANLGIDRPRLLTRNPDLITVSMPAFNPGPQRDWVSYGTGVHALLGLGDDGAGGWLAPPVTYPDPLAGLAALASVLALLVGRQRGHGGRGAEVSLAAASQPLLSIPAQPWNVDQAAANLGFDALAEGWDPADGLAGLGGARSALQAPGSHHG